MKKLLALGALIAATFGFAHAQVVPAPPGTAAMVCANNTSVPSPISGQFFYVQCDSNGKLITSGSSSGPPLNGFLTCTAGVCTFTGADGSTQMVVGTTNNSVDWLATVGGIAGAGGSLIAQSSTDANVAVNITSKGNANVNFANSGSGQLAQGVDPGAPVSTGGQVQLTPSTSSGPAKVGNSVYGVNLDCGTNLKCQEAGAPIQSAGGVYAFNVNGDFQIDQINEGAAAATGNSHFTDGWIALSTFGSNLTYQRSTTVPSSVGPYFTSGKITNGSAQTIISTSINLAQSLVFAYDIAPALWGTAAAKPLTLDACLMSDTAGLTYPALIPVSLNNNSSGSNFQSFVHNVSLSAVNVWTCVSIPIAGPTNNTGFGSVTAPNRISIVIALGCGSNFQTATTDQWVGPSTQVACTSASTNLAATAGADLFVTGVHLRYGGSQNYAVSPFQQLPYGPELLRARKRYWKTFAQGTKPAQNLGANTGEFQFPATAVTTGTQRASSIMFPLPIENSGSGPTVTFFNPSAANGNCRDETAAGDGGAPTSSNVAAQGATAISVSCAGNAATALNNLMGVHIVVDGGL